MSEINNEVFNCGIHAFQSTNLHAIDTLNFLEASRSVVGLIDKFGKIFAPVKHDMNGNIEKLNRKYLEDTITNQNLQSMILAEQAQGGNVATDALMWLRRALQFIHKFFNRFIEESRKGENSNDISMYLKYSYKETLQRYHGFLAQRLFNLLCRLCPSRTDLIAMISKDESVEEEEIISELAVFTENLEGCLKELVNFYDTSGFENHARA